jgi:hypothetical protein
MLLLLFPQLAAAAATTLYVHNDSTSVAGDGSLDSPFGSLQACVDQLLASQPAGSSCLLLPGTYRLNATVEISGLHGDAGAPYTIGAVNETGSVWFDGRAGVPGPWQREQGAGRVLPNGSSVATQHWSAAWPDGLPEPWQLFVDDEMMTVARWPNARWDDRWACALHELVADGTAVHALG